MPKTKRDDPTELLRLALIGFDAQIAELQKTRAQLAALIDQAAARPDVEVAAPQKRRKLSAGRGRKSALPQGRAGPERRRRKQRPKSRNQ
jgi:hypothetical protein